MSYVENPNLNGFNTVRITGVEAFGDHIIEFSGALNTFTATTVEGEVISAALSTGDSRLYDEFITISPIPGRETTAIATFPPSSFGSALQTVKVSARVPLESRGGTPYIEAHVITSRKLELGLGQEGLQRIASLREGNDTVIMRSGDDPAFAALAVEFLSGDNIRIAVSGFEDFGSWTEPRQLSSGDIGLVAWGLN